MVAVFSSNTQPDPTDRYELHEEVGCGGCCRVYRATNLRTQQEVALKMLREDLPLEEKPGDLRFSRARASRILQHEASIHRELSHPSIPAFHAAGKRVLVMGYIPSSFQTLERYQFKFAKRQLPWRVVLKVGLQLASVLAYLHEHKEIVYGDFNFDNVLVGPDEQAALTDFGLARHFGEICPDLVGVGSLGYAPPELFQEDPPTERADIFGLGAVLHQLLSGWNPRCNHPIYSFRELDPSIPAEFARLVSRMIAIEPEKRPSARDIHKKMMAWALQQRVSLPEVGPGLIQVLC